MASIRFDFNTALHQCAQGHPAALQRIYEHEAAQMMAYGLSLLESPSEAEELIRETFILSWKNALGFDPYLGDGRAWLYSIFRYRAQARLLQHHAHRPARQHIPTLPAISANSSPFLRNVSRLDSASRQMLLMAYLQGDNYQHIAHRLGMTLNQARVRLRAALGQLRDTITGLNGQSMGEPQLLIAEYTLGLLSGTEHQQTQAQLQSNDQAAQDALAWEYQLLAFCDSLRSVKPSDQLLWRIQTALGHESTPSSETAQEHDHSRFMPQFLKADAASSLSIPERHETSSHATTTVPATQQHTSGSLTTSEEGKASKTEPLTAISSDSAKNEPSTPAPSGLARFLPKKAAPLPAKAKTEPSLSATDTDSNDDTSAHSPLNHSVKAQAQNNDEAEALITATTQRQTVQQPARVDSPSATKTSSPSSTHPDTDDTSSSRSSRQSGSLIWRFATLVLAVATIALIAKIALTPNEPPINVIEMAPRQAAVLQAPGQSSTPGWILTVDPEGNVLLNPQVETEVSADQSAQLWTQQASSTNPRSLGLIDPNRPVAIPAALIGELETGQVFEITLEDKGGATSNMPSGPVLFIGRLVRFGDLPQPHEPVVTENS
ncbi:MAG TPA: anti-sigma factor [Paenalcaligenes sp.]|nr:anti-sigma factor [Paenalcaligenes sp.]